MAVAGVARGFGVWTRRTRRDGRVGRGICPALGSGGGGGPGWEPLGVLLDAVYGGQARFVWALLGSRPGRLQLQCQILLGLAKGPRAL
jgi:hypothetical protein